jgi:vacuolar-type H+-ATPase subunit C/Vma6
VDRHEFRLLKEILSRRMMSPLIIVWYLILKEAEIKNLRLVFKAVFDGRPPDGIRDSLVMIL